MLVDLEKDFKKQVYDNVKRARRGKAPNVIVCWRHEEWFKDLVQKSPICSVGCMHRATLPNGEYVIHCSYPKYVPSVPEPYHVIVSSDTSHVLCVRSSYVPPKREPAPIATYVEQVKSDPPKERYIDKSDDESDEEEFVDAWGDEPVPVVSSEVLGTQAIEWMSSNAMLDGGRRPRGKKGRRGRGGRGGGQRIPRMLVNRGRSFISDRFRTHLDYDLPFTAPLATALFPYSLEYVVLTNPNNVTTVSTALPGYLGFAAMYRKYRTYKFIFSFIAVNNDNFGIEIFACPVNFVPSLVAAPTRFFSQPECRTKVLSAKGGIDQKTLIWKGSVAGFGGSASTSVEDAYCGTTDNTAPPTDNMYLIYGTNTNGSASVSAPLFRIRVRIFLEFYELQSPTG